MRESQNLNNISYTTINLRLIKQPFLFQFLQDIHVGRRKRVRRTWRPTRIVIRVLGVSTSYDIWRTAIETHSYLDARRCHHISLRITTTTGVLNFRLNGFARGLVDKFNIATSFFRLKIETKYLIWTKNQWFDNQLDTYRLHCRVKCRISLVQACK